MSWGSGAPSRPTGAFTPVWTCEIQSKRMERIFVLTGVRKESACAGGRSSSKNTAHLAVDSIVCLPSSPIGLPHRSSSSRVVFVAKAAARAHAPTSPMLLSGSERRRRAEPGALRIVAMNVAPSSPMLLLPKQSSPSDALCGDPKARATARAPMLLSPRPLSSSSRRYGAARRHCSGRAAAEMAVRRALVPNVGSRSAMPCMISTGRSQRPGPGGGGAALT
mmetsp:Transcript_61760/g.162230  ORF Transcript_61760/g.162230 Transcript_61760/m.162230 type:complete len:221 (-) Transcript_61760:305-967(-)